jgi:hypothetical protein
MRCMARLVLVHVYRILIIKCKAKKTLVRRLDNVKRDHREVGYESAVWIEMTRWKALVNALMNIRIRKTR